MDLPINTNSKSGTFGAFARSKAIAVAGIFSIAMTAQGAPVTLQQPTATFSQASFSIADAIDNGPSSGWAIHPNVGSPQTAVFETATDLFTSGGTLTFTMAQNFGSGHTIGRLRWSATTDDRSLFADGLSSGGDVSANWVVLDPVSLASANGATLTELGDNSILVSGVSPSVDTYTISATTLLAGVTGLRLEVLKDLSLPANGPGRQPSNGNFVLTNLIVDATPAVVPLPPALMLMGTGLLGMLGFVRTNRSRH